MSVFPIGWYDPFDLLCSLKPRLPLFKGDGGVRTLGLRGPKKDAPDPDDAEAYVNAKEAARWTEMKTLMARFSADAERLFGSRIEVGRAYFDMLMPGEARMTRPSATPYSGEFTRMHYCVLVNPGAMLWSGPSSMIPMSGQVVSIGMREWHGAVNQGDTPRVHLVFDIRKRAGELIKTQGQPAEPEAADEEEAR